MHLLQNMTAALAPAGLNLIGTTPVADYDALVASQYHIGPLLPTAKTVIVIGNGGGQFWQHFSDFADARPDYFQQHENPLDAYTVKIIEGALTPHLSCTQARYRYIYPFQFFDGLTISFMHLTQAAGLAGPSLLGMRIHPEYGPWIASRVAILIDQEISVPSVAPGFDPCPTCIERACMVACPANAIDVEKGWNISACVQHRVRNATDCVDRCHARYQCVYGREDRYPEEELAYHQRLSFAAMRKHFEKK